MKTFKQFIGEAYLQSGKKSHKTKPARFFDLLKKTFGDNPPTAPMPIIKKSPPGTVPPVPMPDANDQPILKKNPMAKKSTSIKRA